MSEPQWTNPPANYPSQAAGAPDDRVAGYSVMIEQHEQVGDSYRWLASDASQRTATLQEARDYAYRLAHTFGPNHPMSEQGRTAYRLNLDEFVTIVQGATRSFHFRLRLVELLRPPAEI